MVSINIIQLFSLTSSKDLKVMETLRSVFIREFHKGKLKLYETGSKCWRALEISIDGAIIKIRMVRSLFSNKGKESRGIIDNQDLKKILYSPRLNFHL